MRAARHIHPVALGRTVAAPPIYHYPVAVVLLAVVVLPAIIPGIAVVAIIAIVIPVIGISGATIIAPVGVLRLRGSGGAKERYS